MTTAALEKPAWLAAGRRFLLPGLVALLLLCAPARGESTWPPEDLGQTPDRVRKSGPGPSQCPLPPVSAFSLQTNLLKYLDTWPTPGATTTGDWPEYVPEDGKGLD